MKQWKIKPLQRKPQVRGEKRKRDGAQLEGSNEEVLAFEVKALLSKFVSSASSPRNAGDDMTTSDAATKGLAQLPERFSEIELDILEMSSTGEGLALSPSGHHVYVVPFSIPGDTILAKVVTQFPDSPFSNTDFVKIIKPSPQRDDSAIGCKYFTKCSGCQLQMLPYDDQLKHKKTIIEKAYRNFSGLNPGQVPPIEDTFGSPLQYGYRTKLTPHFDGPGRPSDKGPRRYTEVPPIGFTEKGRKRVMDIESCPIGTDIVQAGLTRERAKVAHQLKTYKNGATILVRETTERTPRTDVAGSDNAEAGENEIDDSVAVEPEPSGLQHYPSGTPYIATEFPKYIETKTYTADMNGPSVEYIDDWRFTNIAGAFFQNNNSILSPFTAYIRDNCIPKTPADPTAPTIKYLLDAYCGSGLFAVTLSSLFTSTLGIDIAPTSIKSARTNAALNNLSQCGFIEADASDLFVDVPFPPDETLLIIDPPRKGASEDFLKQLMRFGPKRVVYVSCNVHTQARDVGLLVRGDGNWKYTIENIRGFDFFPQTGHVEGVAFLNREAIVASGNAEEAQD